MDTPATATPATMASPQTSLFDDPTRLLNLSDGDLARLTAELHNRLGSVMPRLRREVGLVAWAEWHRRTDGAYHAWLEDTAKIVGVDSSTIIRWRRTVTAAEDLAIPAPAAQRQLEQRAAREKRAEARTAPARARAMARDAEATDEDGDQRPIEQCDWPGCGSDKYAGEPCPEDHAPLPPQPPRPLPAPPAPPPTPVGRQPSDPEQRRRRIAAELVKMNDQARQIPPKEGGRILADEPGGVAKAKAVKLWACEMYVAALEREGDRLAGRNAR